MQRNRPGRTHLPPWSMGIAGAVVGIVLIVGIGPSGVLLPRVTVCRIGAQVGSYVIWTPLSLINKPDNSTIGSSTYYNSWNYSFASGSLSEGALPATSTSSLGGSSDTGPEGGLAVAYQNHNWTIFSTSNQTVVGAHAGACTQPYIAEIGATQGCGGQTIIPLQPSNSTDSNEPHVWNGTVGINGSEDIPGCSIQTPGTYVWFNNSFSGNGTGSSAPVDWNLCGSDGTFELELLGVAQIPVRVTVPYEGRDISVYGTLNWFGNPSGSDWPSDPGQPEATAYYEIPGGWNWTLAPVGPASFSIDPGRPLPSLVAFEQSGC